MVDDKEERFIDHLRGVDRIKHGKRSPSIPNDKDKKDFVDKNKK